MIKRRYRTALLAVAGCALVCIIVILNPAFQRWVALGQLEKIDPDAELERLAISPFSSEIRGLKLNSENWQLGLPRLDIKYSPWSLLAKHVKIHRLQVEDLAVQLEPGPSETDETASSQPLPGVWEVTDLGWRISLDELAVNARLELPDSSLSASLSGGGLAPEATGVFNLEISQTQATSESGAVEKRKLSGTLRLSESERGAMTALGWDLNAEIIGPSFESPPRFGIIGDWTAADWWAEASPAEAAEASYPPESFSVEIATGLETSSETRLLRVDGDYDAAGEQIGAHFIINANHVMLAPYAGELDLPKFDGEVDGKLDWNLAKMSGKSSIKLSAHASELGRLSDTLEGVGDLEVEGSHELSFESDRVRLEKFGLEIKNANGDEVIALETSHPLTFSAAMVEAENVGEYGFERPWLSVNTEIPLEWFDPVLGSHRLAGAQLRGRLNFSGRPLEHLMISSDSPFEAKGMTLSEGNSVLLEDVAIFLSPQLELWPDRGEVTLGGFQVSARGHDLLRADLTADIAFGTAENTRANVNAEMEAFIDGLLSQPLGEILPETATAAQSRVIEMSNSLGPSSLKMSLNASANDQGITANKLSAKLVRDGGGIFLEAELTNPLEISQGDTGLEFNGTGENWLKAAIHDLPVKALAAFSQGYRLEGGSIRGGFTLAAGADPGGFLMKPTEPWAVNGLTIGPEDGGLWMDAVDVKASPSLDYTPGRARLELVGFNAAQGSDNMVEGELSVDVALSGFDPESVDFSLDGKAALVPLFEQPALAPLLPQPFEQATSARIKLQGRTDLTSADFSELSLQWFSENDQSLLSFALTEPLVVKRLDISDLEAVLNAVEGKGSYTMEQLPLRLPLALIETAPISVAAGTTSGTLAWEIGQGRAKITTTKALRLDELTLSSNENNLLKSVSFAVDPSLDLSSKAADLRFDAIELAADGEGPLAGEAGVSLNWEDGLALKNFEASLAGDDVSPWFEQGFMPENQVTGGRFEVTAASTAKGRRTVDLKLNDFHFRDEDPALSLARIEITADRDNSKDSWPGNASMNFETPGGRSDLTADFTWLNQDSGPLLTIDTTGDRLHVGDLKRLVGEFGAAQQPESAAVEKPDVGFLAVDDSAKENPPSASDEPESGSQRKEPPEEIDFDALADTAEAPEVLETDSVPFWNDLPADLDFTFSLNEVLYTDYLKFTDLAGKVVANPERIGLERFKAHFYEAGASATGILDWDAGETKKPYGLAMNFDLSEFDLNAFFTELNPEEKARVEGLFRMAVNAEGRFPRLDVAQNHIRFVFDLESLEGLFRAIPPDSALAQNSSKAAARAGAILSWTPTGGLALGALSRLVTAMREIPYNRIAIKIVRGPDLNVQIKEMVVRSPEILIQGRGGILYEKGVDLAGQRLDLTTEMDARGNMASILSGLGLLRQDRLENDYWRGFRFRIWGSLEEPESNFGAIVTEAAADALTHNLTNPFLGIWSNIKFRGTEVE